MHNLPFVLFSNKGPKGLLQVATKYNIIQCIHSLVTSRCSALVLVLLVPVLAFISVHIPFRALCIIFYLYFICILRVTLCEYHGEIKSYLLTYFYTALA